MGVKIRDEFAELPLSRQRKKQLRYQRDGLCVVCGKRRNPSSAMYCTAHKTAITNRRHILAEVARGKAD